MSDHRNVPTPDQVPHRPRPALSPEQLIRSHALRAAAALWNGTNATDDEVLATARLFAEFVRSGRGGGREANR